jgi:hypothetical protein
MKFFNYTVRGCLNESSFLVYQSFSQIWREWLVLGPKPIVLCIQQKGVGRMKRLTRANVIPNQIGIGRINGPKCGKFNGNPNCPKLQNEMTLDD